MAKKLIDSNIGLTIDARYTERGNRFCLFWTAAPFSKPLEPDEIDIENLSIDRYLEALPFALPFKEM